MLDCHYSCLTCITGKPENCTDCESKNFRELTTFSYCNCLESFFDTDNMKKCGCSFIMNKLIECHYSCLSCKGKTKRDCLTCRTGERILK
jgi:hypothetical protein